MDEKFVTYPFYDDTLNSIPSRHHREIEDDPFLQMNQPFYSRKPFHNGWLLDSCPRSTSDIIFDANRNYLRRVFGLKQDDVKDLVFALIKNRFPITISVRLGKVEEDITFKDMRQIDAFICQVIFDKYFRPNRSTPSNSLSSVISSI